MFYKHEHRRIDYGASMIKHDDKTIDGRLIFSKQDCACVTCYRRTREVLLEELKSLNIIETSEPDVMRLTEKFADALPNSDDHEIAFISNEDIWGTLITRFNQNEPDAIQDYGIIIRMVIDILIETHRKNTTNKHGGDMYGV